MQDIRDNDKITKIEDADRFPCPGCGAVMTFNPGTQTLYCGYCSKSIDIAAQEGDIEEYDLSTAEDDASQDWGSEKRLIKCESCGAETVLDIYATAQFCAFCGSSHVISSEDTYGIMPESLIPFKVTGDNARQLFKKWIKKRFFAPNSVKKNHQADKMSGVYVPYWTYDSDTISLYTAQKGTYYYVTRTDWVTRNGKRVQVTKRERRIRWEPVSGAYSAYFDDMLVNASKNADARLMAKLEPFHMNELVGYQPEFISGFLAERYFINLKEGWQTAKETIKSIIRNNIINKINGDEVRGLRINTTYKEIKYKHLLLPVWMSSYRFKKKVYRYLVNGQTGEVQGQSPVSFWKIAGLVIAGLAAAAAVYVAAGGSF